MMKTRILIPLVLLVVLGLTMSYGVAAQGNPLAGTLTPDVLPVKPKIEPGHAGKPAVSPQAVTSGPTRH